MNKSNGFPFLDLPFLAQNEVIKYMRLRDVFELSMLSKRTSNVTRLANLKFNCLQWRVSVEPSNNRVWIGDGDDILLNIMIQPLGGIFVNWDEDCDPGSTYYKRLDVRNEETQLTAIDQMTESLLKVFTFTDFTGYIDEGVKLRTCFLFKHVRNFFKLEIGDIEGGNGASMSEDDLRFVLNDLNAKTLFIHSAMDNVVRYTGDLNNETLSVSRASWITLTSILESNVENLSLSWNSLSVEDSRFSNADVNQILKAWTDGGLNKLKSFKIKIDEEISEADTLGEILTGIEQVVGVEADNEDDADNGDDGGVCYIRRQSGQLGSVWVDTDYYINFASQ